LRITSGLIVISTPSWRERETGGSPLSFLSLVVTTLSSAFANISKGLSGSDFTFSGSGGVGNFTYSSVKGIADFTFFPLAIEVDMPLSVSPAHF
jgi:hypothetical protein